MEFKKALHIMQHSVKEDERRPMKLVVVIQSQGAIGGTPCVDVGNVQAGFDWDSGKLMIYPSKPLTPLSPDDVAAIRDSVSKGQSWHAYQNHKAMDERVKAAEAQRDELLRRLRAAEAMAASRIEQIAADTRMLAIFADISPEHRGEAEEFTTAIQARTSRRTLVAYFPPDADITALNEEQARAAGWVRA